MATLRQVTVQVSRKVSKNYNSTDYSYGVTLDVDDGESLEVVCAEYTDRLKTEIRKAFGSNGIDKEPASLSVPQEPRTEGASDAYRYEYQQSARTARNSDPQPYTERETVVDPLTQRPVVREGRSGNTTDQAIARGHLKPDPSKPSTWPVAGEPLVDVPAVKAGTHHGQS